ncbi:MAG: beta-ketoacyl-[acyl-carrier-protein] synthase family protein [Polyangiaceae bacterium]|jgi:3-oxoacyl-[acyl-carrier-protein] synthase II
MDEAVVVTGLGAASALGTGLDAHRAALREGRDGLRAIARFDTSRMTARLGGTWPGWDGRVQPEPGRDLGLTETAADFPLHELALVAAREAWEGARLGPVAPRRAALVFGTCFGHGFAEFHAVADRIARAFDLAGPRITISTACASSTNAIGVALDLLRRGRADVVVAGGADTLLREAFAGFSALGVLSPEKCAPFSEPEGTTLGEGAGFVVLERASDARRRDVLPWGSIHGYGLSADGFHETTPDPTGAGVARAIRGALGHAGWDAASVDFVSAHATGTTNNDRIEWSVLERELGGAGAPPPVCGSKSQLGHTQGAAGVLELVLALLCHRAGEIPSTLHFRGPRPGCPGDPVAAPRPRAHAVSRALKLSAAFGGANAVLAYGGPTVAPTTRAGAPSRVLVRGVGVVGPSGSHATPGVDVLTRGRVVGPCAEVDLGRVGVDPRRLDRSARWLTAASVLALGNGGRPLAGEAGARTGLFVGATRMPEESSRRCHAAIRKHGVAGTSASAFARMSVNAPAGACARALGLLGPTTTVSTGPGSGLLAVALAAEWLALRGDTDRIVAGGLDELARSADDGKVGDEAEGAACLVLERAQTAEDDSPAVVVVVAGWGLAGPENAGDAARQALGSRGGVDGILVDGEPRDLAALTPLLVAEAPVGLVDGAALWGAADGSRSCVLAALAVAYLEAGSGRSLLVVAARGTSSVALLFERSAR